MAKISDDTARKLIELLEGVQSDAEGLLDREGIGK